MLILDQASEEKKRLEEKQRAARKNRSKLEEDWKTRCDEELGVGGGAGWGGLADGGLQSLAHCALRVVKYFPLAKFKLKGPHVCKEKGLFGR